MSAPKVYVAAPYDRAWAVRTFHGMLRAHGAVPVSHWANCATGPEKLETMSRAEVLSLIEVNDTCLRQADLVVCLAVKGKGAETFAEVARALEWRKPVLWCGQLALSAYREGVYLCETQKVALEAIGFASGYSSCGVPLAEVLTIYFRGEDTALARRSSA